MKKRIISLVLVIVLMFSMVVNAAASTGTQNVDITYRAISINLNGRIITPCDAAGKTIAPFIMNSNGTTYLPLRAISQALGLNVVWDGATSTITLTSGGAVKTGKDAPSTDIGTHNVSIAYRDIKIILDGKQLDLRNSAGAVVEPFIMDGTTYLPLRIVGEALGLPVAWDKATSTASLGVDESGITGISLNQSSISYKPGQTFTLVAVVNANKDGADKTVTWSSSDPSIATVAADGTVTMVKPGTAVVTAKTVNGKIATCEVVVETVAATGVSLNKTQLSADIGHTEKLVATVSPDNVTDASVTWSSSNTKVATVDQSGNVKTIGYGSATITVTTKNGYTATCTVSVIQTPWYSASLYRIGVDIPAGVYYCVATSNSGGYYCKYTDSTQDDIEDNDNFQTFTYIQTYPGQYLKLSRCKITPVEYAPSVSASADGYYGEGTYRVGIDIPAGDYYAAATSTSGGYYCNYTDITKNDIENNANFQTFYYFRVSEGQLLKINRCKMTAIENAPSVSASADGYYSEGMYRVGFDIPAGEYKFVATSNSGGYYCVYTDITQEDIEDNDNFDSVAYYTVQNGQYLKVNRAKFQYVGAPDVPAPTDPDTGDNGGNTDKKYSFTDAKNLNSYLAKATSATTTALQTCNKVFSAGYTGYAYANQAIGYVSSSMSYLKLAISILESHVPLELTDSEYATMLDMAKASYDLLDSIDGLKFDSNNYRDVLGNPLNVIMKAGNLNLRLQKLSVELLEAFT